MESTSNRYLLAIDPSIISSGVALFYGDKLIAAGTIAIGTNQRCLAQRCEYMASLIRGWFTNNASRWLADKVDVVFEWPRIYPRQRGKKPNDLPALVGVGMAVCKPFYGEVYCYYPQEWAGQLPKAKGKQKADASPRAQRIWSRLTEEEKNVWPKGQHDALDAIGIGLYHLKRFDPRKVYEGVTYDEITLG